MVGCSAPPGKQGSAVGVAIAESAYKHGIDSGMVYTFDNR